MALIVQQRLFVRLKNEGDKAVARIKLLLVMFPGDDQLVLYFEETKRKIGAKCVIHPALVAELKEMLGDENVVVK